MGFNIRTNFKKGFAIIAIISIASCGKTEAVKGIKGEQGDKGPKGEQGEDGENARTIYITPTPQPQQTYPVPPQTYPLPPIIIVNNPYEKCPSAACPDGNILICACIDNRWQTISVGIHNYKNLGLNIRHHGPCEYRQSFDCFGNPPPQNNRC